MDLDKYIPNRSATNFEFGCYLLQGEGGEGGGGWGKKIDEVSSDYQKLLADALGMKQTRIFSFRNKPRAPLELFFSSSPSTARPVKKPREKIPFSLKTERLLDVPDLADNYYLNLLDWSSSNVIAVALEKEVYLWDGNNHRFSLLVTFNYEVTSVSWAPDGERIAIDLENSEVELWDSTANRKVRTLKGGHRSRVGSLAWNKQILTTGGMDGRVFNNDVRVRDHIVERYRGHKKEVCGFKWSDLGEQLASGGNDNLVYIWDRSLATRKLHRLEGHKAAVKALAWCPFQSNFLASGGGSGDHCIRFWNTETGACPKSVDTGSQVCSLLWSKTEKELVSSRVWPKWVYPVSPYALEIPIYEENERSHRPY